MKLSDRKHYPAVSKLSIAASLLMATLWSGCKPQTAAETLTPKKIGTESAAREYPSAVPTSFDAVTSQLDPGGNLYAFMGTRQWMEGVSDKIENWRDVILDIQDESPEDKLLVSNVFNLVTTLIDRSGVEEVAGVGISGIAIEPDLYRTKLFVHRNGTGEPTGIWTLFGSEPHEFSELDFLPTDTVWATSSDFDLAGLWRGLESTADSSGIPQLEKGFGQAGGVVQAMTGKPLSELLDSLGGSMGAFVTFNEEQMISFPVDGTTLEMPEPGIVIGVKVKDDTLFDLLNGLFASNPDLIIRDEGDLRMSIVPMPLPIPLTLRATIASYGDYLFLASNDGLIEDMLAVKNGETEGLKSDTEFVRLSKGVPLTGNSFNYLSARFMKTIEDLQMKTMASNSGLAGNDNARSFMDKLSTLRGSPSAYTVGRSTQDGWLTISHGTQEPATAIIVPLVVVPTAILAGLTFPALSKAKEKAARISCVNNMKQLGLGVLIHANDHDDRFPDEIKEMGAELQLTRPLICPLAPNFEDRDSFEWKTLTLDELSYEYLGKGMTTETDPSEVIWRCRYHDNAGLADGSVVQN